MPASSGLSAAPSPSTSQFLKRTKINKLCTHTKIYNSCNKHLNVLITLYCLLQFVVQFLLLIGQIGDITRQGPISFFQLQWTANTFISALLWNYKLNLISHYFQSIFIGLEMHCIYTSWYFQDCGELFYLTAFKRLTIQRLSPQLDHLYFTQTQNLTELMVMSFSESSWRWRAIISFSSSSFIIFSFSRSEYCSSAMERASCSESAFVRVISSCAAKESLRGIKRNASLSNPPHKPPESLIGDKWTEPYIHHHHFSANHFSKIKVDEFISNCIFKLKNLSPLLLQLLQRLLHFFVEFVPLLTFLLQLTNLGLIESLEKR